MSTTSGPTQSIAESAVDALRATYRAEIVTLKDQIKDLTDKITGFENDSLAIKKSIAGSVEVAGTASADFKQNLDAFGEFHSNYNQELQRVLQKRLDYTDPAFNSRQEIQNNRMKYIEEDLNKIELLKMKILKKNDNEIRSIICKANSTKLNVEPIMAGQNPTGTFTIYLNNQCLHYNESFGSTEKSTVDTCEYNSDNNFNAFRLKLINNFSEYNDAIKKENTGFKKLVTKGDDIYYPFYLVNPVDNDGKCVYVNDEGEIYVKTIESGPNSRFKTSQTVAFGACPDSD
jgi:hypothetical protein